MVAGYKGTVQDLVAVSTAMALGSSGQVITIITTGIYSGVILHNHFSHQKCLILVGIAISIVHPSIHFYKKSWSTSTITHFLIKSNFVIESRTPLLDIRHMAKWIFDIVTIFILIRRPYQKTSRCTAFVLTFSQNRHYIIYFFEIGMNTYLKHRKTKRTKHQKRSPKWSSSTSFSSMPSRVSVSHLLRPQESLEDSAR